MPHDSRHLRKKDETEEHIAQDENEHGDMTTETIVFKRDAIFKSDLSGNSFCKVSESKIRNDILTEDLQEKSETDDQLHDRQHQIENRFECLDGVDHIFIFNS